MKKIALCFLSLLLFAQGAMAGTQTTKEQSEFLKLFYLQVDNVQQQLFGAIT